MKKELVREVPFGKATARVTVTYFHSGSIDTVDEGWEPTILKKVKRIEIIHNGKVVQEGNHAEILEYREGTAAVFEANNYDANKKYSRIGRAATVGEESSLAIRQAIKKMHEELSAEFEIDADHVTEEKEEAEIAQEVVKIAEKEGIENLMTSSEIKTWRKKYNDLMNEGREGFIPTKISKERYKQALKTLKEAQRNG